MSKRLFVESFLLLGFAALGIYDGARLLKEPLIIYDYIGPGGYLLYLSIMLFICGVIYLLVNARHKVVAVNERSSLDLGPPIRASLVLALYAALVPFIGYALGTTFFFVLAFRIFGVSSWIRSIILGLISAGAFQLIFSYLLGIPLP